MADGFVLLADLPYEHPLRTTPLAEIRAECRNVQSARWTLITPAFGIAKVSYNGLFGSWKECNEWRAPAP